MNISLKRTEEQVELVKAMASKNREVSYEAQAALAEFIGPVLDEVVQQAPVISNLFTTFEFDADDNPSIPLDLYYDITDEDYIQVYSTSIAGGMPTSAVAPTHSELKFTTYTLDSAVEFLKKYAAKSRLDVVSKTFTRVAQEILLKQQRTSANILLGTLKDATSTDYSGSTIRHVIDAGTPGTVKLDDFNRLLTRAKRINTSWAGGTGMETGRGITDLLCSPEVVQNLREMAYNPVNTRDSSGTGPPADANSGVIAGTTELRNSVYNSAGLPEFFGISIMEANEFGIGQKFNNIYIALGGVDESGAAITATDEVAVGLDRSRESLMRAVALDGDTGSQFTLLPDDQYSVRQQKIGFYGSMEEGRMILDNRAVFGLIVDRA
jgi:hypothetical protein